jgi:hypothetical protein
LEGDGNRGNKVPYKGYRFANKSKFDSSIYNKVIDPDYFYELIGVYLVDKHFTKISSDSGPSVIQVLQFYPDGKVRRFAKTGANPNPEVDGLRGVIYKRKKKIKIDIFEGVSGGGDMAIVTSRVMVEGDRLYLLEYPPLIDYIFIINYIFPNEIPCDVYEKKEKVPEEWKKYKPDW